MNEKHTPETMNKLILAATPAPGTNPEVLADIAGRALGVPSRGVSKHKFYLKALEAMRRLVKRRDVVRIAEERRRSRYIQTPPVEAEADLFLDGQRLDHLAKAVADYERNRDADALDLAEKVLAETKCVAAARFVLKAESVRPIGPEISPRDREVAAAAYQLLVGKESSERES